MFGSDVSSILSQRSLFGETKSASETRQNIEGGRRATCPLEPLSLLVLASRPECGQAKASRHATPRRGSPWRRSTWRCPMPLVALRGADKNCRQIAGIVTLLEHAAAMPRASSWEAKPVKHTAGLPGGAGGEASGGRWQHSPLVSLIKICVGVRIV